VSYYEIAGLEDFEGLGADIATIVPPDEWLTADEPTRRMLAQWVQDLIRWWWALDGSVLVFADLAPGTHGRYELLDDEVTVSSLLVLEDDPSSLLATLAHENRHAVQNAIVAGVLPYPHGSEAASEVDMWREADATYDPEDLVAYMYSPVETDARAAEAGVQIGYWKHAYEVVRE